MAYFTQHVQCMLLTGNSAQFRILRSYMLLLKSPFLCAFVAILYLYAHLTLTTMDICVF